MDGGQDRVEQLEMENRRLRLQVARLEIQVMEMTVMSIQEQHPKAVARAQEIEREIQALTKGEPDAG